MKQALVITLKDVCADGWDDETEEAWKRVYDWMAAELVVTK
jgi:hemoglobin-like flavoprotein